MKTIDPLSPPATGAATAFATGISSPVDIQVANDGSLYYLARGTNSVFRVQYFGGSTLAINDVSITEGNAGNLRRKFHRVSFTRQLADSDGAITQLPTTRPLSRRDYQARSGTVTFHAGRNFKDGER